MAKEDLTSAEVASLRILVRNNLLRPAIPDAHRKRLLGLGYAEQKIGGLMATAAGMAYIVTRGG